MPHRPPSLALRLITLIGLATALVLLVFDWVIVRSIESHFSELDAEKLAIHATAIAHALENVGQRHDRTDTVLGTPNRIVAGHEALFLQIQRSDGEVLYQSPEVDLSALIASTPPVASIDAENLHQWRDLHRAYRGAVLTLSNDDGSLLTVAVATSINVHLHYLEDFQRTLILTTVGAFITLLVAAWVAVHQGHAPLRQVTARIRTIRSDQLHIRLAPETLPEELIELARSVNEMLERIEQGFHQLSHFSADIAHELRTPVTNLMTQTQVALSEPRSVGEYREILYSNLEEYERMAQMIGDMLFLAKTDNGLLKPDHQPVDLAHEVRALFDFLGAWAEERQVDLSLQGHVVAPGDRLMLRRALSNLLSNAIRHTPTGGSVRVQLANDDEHLWALVENTGNTIPAEHLGRLFDRFYRIDPARQRDTEGAGLGLAIAKSIIEIHGGSLSVSSVNGITRFRIELPWP